MTYWREADEPLLLVTEGLKGSLSRGSSSSETCKHKLVQQNFTTLEREGLERKTTLGW